jgi:hypothetical protein
MNEIMKSEGYMSTSRLSKLGVSAVGFTAAGICLFIFNAVIQLPVVGIIIGGLVLLFGLAAFRSRDKADKRAGIIITTAGILAILSRIPINSLQGISGFLLGAGAFGLLAVGIINAIKFFKGLKQRS